MVRSKLMALAILTVGLAVSSAIAADLPRKAPLYSSPVDVIRANWSGFFMGVNGGYGFTNQDMGVSSGNALSQTIQNIGLVPSSLGTRDGGFVAGGQVGYNWQMGFVVFGLEADFQYADLDRADSRVFSTTPLGLPATLTTTGQSSLDWFGTVRGRAGFTVGDSLIYGTGGFAYGKTGASASVALASPFLNASMSAEESSTQTGWAAGAGWEHRFLGNWSMKAEYLYMDLGSTTLAMSTTVLGAPVAYTADVEHKYHIVRAGLNYKF